MDSPRGGRKHKRLGSWNLAKYVLSEILPSFFTGITIFLLIMLMSQAIRLSEFVVIHHVGMRDIGAMSVYMMTSFLPIAIPIAFLFAVLMGISRANSEGEILALQVNGISLRQIFFPVGVLSVVVSVVCLYAALYTVPQGNRSFELLITRLRNERVMEALKPGVFNGAFHGLVLFAEHIVPVKNEMKRVFIYDEREESHPLAITAQAGLLKFAPEQGVLTLRLTNGSIHEDKKVLDPTLLTIDFDVYDINLNVDQGGGGWRDYTMPSYTYPQLKQRLAETVPDPPMHRQFAVEIHRRFSLSFSCVVFAALGFFIGILSQRGMRGTATVLCLVVGLVYWLNILMANALAARGWGPPWLGVWFPNFAFTGVSYYCYRRYQGG